MDIQISAGYMHSGYPIAAQLDASYMLDPAQYMSDWGPFHELGHNHQWMAEVIPGTNTRLTVLYSIHNRPQRTVATRAVD